MQTLAAAVAVQLTIGVAYIWSVFQTGVAGNLFGGDNAAAGLTFSLVIATMCVGSVVGGRMATRMSIRAVVFLGGAVYGAGFVTASFVTPDCAWLLWLSYGVAGGMGMGLAYSTTIACAQRWYPRRKGLVTGLVVSALGFGGVIFNPPVLRLVNAFGGEGVGEGKTFMVLGAVAFAVFTLGSLFIREPPEGHAATTGAAAAAKTPSRDFTLRQMLLTPQFYIITFTFMFACMGGLMMIAFARPVAEMKGLGAAATAGILAISVSNSAGRLVWGAVSDKFGRANTIMLLLALATVSTLLVNTAEGNMVFALIALIGFTYGGFLGVFPALTAEVFGAKHMATNYGVVLFGFGIGAILSSKIAGYYKNIATAEGDIGRMFPAFVIASCCAAVGLAMMFGLRFFNKKTNSY